jgi:predicted amino acid dehydrogenase
MAILDKLLRRNTMSEVATAIEVNCATGEVIERPLTAEEMTQREAEATAHAVAQAAREAAEAAAQAAKESAQSKLAALGLTAEEIAALSK